MKKNSLKTRLLYLMAVVSLNACNNFPVKDMTPEVLDPSRGYARVYKIRDLPNQPCGDPTYEIYDSGIRLPIDQMAGHVAVPTEQMQTMIRYYNEWQRRNANCPSQINENRIMEELRQ